MKIHIVIAFALALMVSGCSRVPQEVAEKLAHAQVQFKNVKSGMMKEEVIAALGPPARQENTHRCHWKVRYDKWNYESITVDFDDAGKVIGTRIKHSAKNALTI